MSGWLRDLSALPKEILSVLSSARSTIGSNLGVDSIRGCLAIVVLAMKRGIRRRESDTGQ